VRAYFAAGERKAGTGARLGIHPKTVAHRLARVEQLLGAPIESRRIDLETALLLHQALAGRG
jgi:DNA-binding PucR family transcriptional regulator